MKIKSFLIVLALIMLVASLGVAQAFGGNLFGMGSESGGAIEIQLKQKTTIPGKKRWRLN